MEIIKFVVFQREICMGCYLLIRSIVSPTICQTCAQTRFTLLSVSPHEGCEHFQERARLQQKSDRKLWYLPVPKSHPNTEPCAHTAPPHCAEPASEAEEQPAGKPFNDVFHLGGRNENSPVGEQLLFLLQHVSQFSQYYFSPVETNQVNVRNCSIQQISYSILSI